MLRSPRILLALSVFALISAPAHAGRNAGELLNSLYHESAPEGVSSGPEGFEEAANPAVNWAQPPLGCAEEMVPGLPDRACLDLTTVADPLNDWPASLSAADKSYWYSHRRFILYCRSNELLRREAAKPGSQSATAVELSWMAVMSVDQYKQNVAAVYQANKTYGVPIQVLIGAIYQESMFANLGIYTDGGNYSCGVQQSNLNGWCEWIQTQPAATRQAVGWPATNVNCDDTTTVNLSFFDPLYKIALTTLNGLPEYRLMASNFANITLAQVQGNWPSATAAQNQLRWQLIQSFIKNCSNPTYGVPVIAKELQGLYNSYISSAFKAKDRYASGDHFQRACQQLDTSGAYPLHTGWVMADSAYNAGPRSIDAIAYYNQWSKTDMNTPATIAGLTPDLLTPSLYWAGQYNSTTDEIDFTGQNGQALDWIWFKGCVVQRHVARVQQHVTLLPVFFVDTLEGNYPCAKSTFDSSGHLVKTSVPPFRQTSSGVKGTQAR